MAWSFEMFGRNSNRNNSSPERSPEIQWLSYAVSTCDFVQELLRSDNEIFTNLSGAVFALHQDTLRLYGIDMRRTDDAVWNAALDRMQPHRFGDFPERAGKVLRAMHSIDNTNLDFISKGAPDDIDANTFRAHAFLARLRSTAARIWLMTIMSKQETEIGRQMVLSIETIWMALELVSRANAADRAEAFTGTYFDGIRSEKMNPAMWPQRHDVIYP